jgi:hypothetical protein
MGQAILPKLLRCILKPLTNYHDASELAKLEPTFRQVPITGHTYRHIRRAATFGMILIVSKIQISNRNWHVRCSDLNYEIKEKGGERDEDRNIIFGSLASSR